MQYELVVRPDGDRFRAICPQIPGIVGYGSTAGQALDAVIVALNKRLEPAHASVEIVVVRAETHAVSARA